LEFSSGHRYRKCDRHAAIGIQLMFQPVAGTLLGRVGLEHSQPFFREGNLITDLVTLIVDVESLTLRFSKKLVHGEQVLVEQPGRFSGLWCVVGAISAHEDLAAKIERK
jgi:hypothetical protein